MRAISVKAVVISSIFDVVVSAVASGIFAGIMVAALGALGGQLRKLQTSQRKIPVG